MWQKEKKSNFIYWILNKPKAPNPNRGIFIAFSVCVFEKKFVWKKTAFKKKKKQVTKFSIYK